MSIKSGFRLRYVPMTIRTSGKWAIAAKELGFPKQTDGKRMVREWWAVQKA